MMHHDAMKHASPNHCSRCHGEGDGFKCPTCGVAVALYDPDHFRKCPEKAKMRVKCRKCGQAEDNCTCR